MNPPGKHRGLLVGQDYVEALTRAVVTLHERRKASDKVRGAQPDEVGEICERTKPAE